MIPQRTLLFLALTLTVPLIAHSQEKKSKDKEQTKTTQAQVPAAPAPTNRPPLAFGLLEDTPVKLKLTRTMSSHDAKVDEKVDFEVIEDVKVGEVVVVQHGGMAIATVTEAKPKGRMGKAGKLNMNIDYVQLISGEKAPLRAVKGGSGGSHTGAMTGAIVATSILFFPAAPFFLFMHGKDLTIPKGTEITAYIAGDTPLDPARFKQSTAVVSESTASKSEGITPNLSAVAIKSAPDGAEITIDGKLMGTTPSTIQLSSGDHIVVLEKSGFKTWQRTITVNAGGSINLEANLEKTP